MLVLVHKDTQRPVEKDEILTDFRGDRAMFVEGVEPHHSGSTGRVYIRELDEHGDPIDRSDGYYPSVYNLVWKEISNG